MHLWPPGPAAATSRPVTVHLRRRRPGLRRLLAAGLVAGAAAAALPVLAPAPAPRVTVLVAARDLPAGLRLTPADVRVAAWAPGTRPRGAVPDASAATGQTLSAALSEGSPVTDAGLLGPGLLAGQAIGLLAVPIQLTGPAPAGLVQTGDHVDVLSGATGSSVATDAVVLAADGRGAGDGSASLGALAGGSGQAGGTTLLVLAVGPEAAGRLTQAQAAGPLGLAVHARAPTGSDSS